MLRRCNRLMGLALVCFLTAYCTSRTSLDLSSIPSALFDMSTIDNIPFASIPRDASGKAYFNQCAYTFQGTCARGVATLQISVNGVAQTPYVCPFSGAASFSYTGAANGEYDFSVTPTGWLGSALTGPITLQTFCSNAPPPPPTIVEPSPMFGNGGILLHGNFSNNPADTISGIVVTGDAGVGTLNVDLVAGTFTYAFAPAGGTYNLTFRTKNYVGAVSTAVPFVIIAHSMLAMNGFTGAATAPRTSTNQLVTISSAPMLVAPIASTNKLYGGIPAAAAEGP